MERPTEDQIGKWYPRLFRTALRLTGNPEDAADVTQQAFCQALRRWDRFDGGALRTTWLHQIVLNCVRDWVRRRSIRRSETIDAWALATLKEPGLEASTRLEQREQMLCLRRAIEGLASKTRSAFVATVLDGYTYEEAADLLSVPVGTIASRVHEAREHLRGTLQQSFPEA